MPEFDFDTHANSYQETLRTSLGPFGNKAAFFDVFKVDCIREYLPQAKQECVLLDFGCGIGKLTGLLAREFQHATVYGYDISSSSLRIAEQETAKLRNVHFINDLSTAQPFDLIIASGVFHHIKTDDRVGILRMLKSNLKDGGKIIIFEHNPLNPLTRYIVHICPFDIDVQLIWRHTFYNLAAQSNLKIETDRYVLFFPWSSPILRKIERLLNHVPLGAQYMLILGNG